MSAVVWREPPAAGARRGLRRIEVRVGRWFATVELDRDDYVKQARSAGHTDGGGLNPAFATAIRRCADAAYDHLWVNGYSGGFLGGLGPSYVTLPVPFALADEAAEALRTAEMEGDVTPLEALTTKLAIPLDQWLAPGERQLRRGIDFAGSPSGVLTYLRQRASARGLRLNGRAVPGGVWVRPQMPAANRELRAQIPSQLAAWADPALYAESQIDDDGPMRPYVGGRVSDNNGSADPIQFLTTESSEPAESCPCGFHDPWAEHNQTRHTREHMRWATGIPLPRNLAWYGGDTAIVTATSPIRWRQLAYQAALLPKRENHYDFASFSVGAGEPESDNPRAFLCLDPASRRIVGFVSVWDSPYNRWHPDRDPAGGPTPAIGRVRPTVNVIFTAHHWRRRGIGRRLVTAIAQHAGIAPGEIAWSQPFSPGGRALAHSVSPSGVWLPAAPE